MEDGFGYGTVQQDIEMELAARRVSHSLLVNKQPGYGNESETSYVEENDNKLKLPKLREKLTLHLTTGGAKLLKSKYSYVYEYILYRNNENVIDLKKQKNGN